MEVSAKCRRSGVSAGRPLLAESTSLAQRCIAAVEDGTLTQFPGWPPAATSNLRLFRDFEGIVDFNTQVPHC